MDNKTIFCDIYEKKINRNGAKELLEWLKKTDFFSAPASAKGNLSCEGGLVKHSMNVYHLYRAEMKQWAAVITGGNLTPELEESIAICGLLHDLSKTQLYKVSSRNVKNEQTGQWEKVPTYTVEDQFPYGHGEKSVWLIERFMRLSVEESLAIRWQKGGFDDSALGGNKVVHRVYEKYALALLLNVADMKATYLLDNR